MLTPEELFDFSHTAHADIFDGTDYAWEIFPLIAEYLDYVIDRSEIHTDVSKAAYIGKNVVIGEGTEVLPGAYIEGPTIIGSNCVIRPGAFIRGNAIIGDNCMIGNSTEVKNAFLFNGALAPHFNYVGDSILGHKTHLGSSVVLSNLKSAQTNSTVKVTTLEGTIDTGLRKFGAIIGDEVEIGANAVLNPGTIVGARSVIYPLAMIRGVVQPDTIVKVRQQQEIVSKKPMETLE